MPNTTPEVRYELHPVRPNAIDGEGSLLVPAFQNNLAACGIGFDLFVTRPKVLRIDWSQPLGQRGSQLSFLNHGRDLVEELALIGKIRRLK
jgi:hypothetical protein